MNFMSCAAIHKAVNNGVWNAVFRKQLISAMKLSWEIWEITFDIRALEISLSWYLNKISSSNSFENAFIFLSNKRHCCAVQPLLIYEKMGCSLFPGKVSMHIRTSQAAMSEVLINSYLDLWGWNWIWIWIWKIVARSLRLSQQRGQCTIAVRTASTWRLILCLFGLLILAGRSTEV